MFRVKQVTAIGLLDYKILFYNQSGLRWFSLYVQDILMNCLRKNREDLLHGIYATLAWCRFAMWIHRQTNNPKTVFSSRIHNVKAENYVYTSTLFYLTTRITTSLTPFRVMAGNVAFAAIPVYRESGPTRLFSVKVKVKQSHYTPGQGEAPRFLDNLHMKVIRLSALRTGRLYPQEIFLVLISVRG
jgi:hypothetical protein